MLDAQKQSGKRDKAPLDDLAHALYFYVGASWNIALYFGAFDPKKIIYKIHMTNSFFLFSLALGVATGALGGYIAEKKGRTQRFGFIIGFLFGLIGVLGLMLMANKPPNDKISDGSE